MNKVSKKQIEDYIAFLEKAVNSSNLKNNDPIKHEKCKLKLANERLKLRLLFPKD